MLPDGVMYHASWIERGGARCYQLMEAPDRPALEHGTERWSDLVDFATDDVVLAADFWRDLRG
jgi:hypothetical protein